MPDELSACTLLGGLEVVPKHKTAHDCSSKASFRLGTCVGRNALQRLEGRKVPDVLSACALSWWPSGWLHRALSRIDALSIFDVHQRNALTKLKV